MPLFDPRTPVELNAAKKLLEGAGTLSDIVGNLYNKYAPAPVKEGINYWNNTPDPIPGPSPDDPLKMASIVVPWLLMRGGKAAVKAKKIVEKKFGVRDIEELMNIPYTRYQQEAVDIPVSQGGRGGIFTTPSIGHTKVDPDMYHNPHAAVEGGAHKVQGVATTKNPLFIDRDIRKYPDESHEYLGARVMKDLLGERAAGDVQIALEFMSGRNNAAPDLYESNLNRGFKVINSLFTPKERKMLYSAKAGNIAMEEAVANKLANRVGYDTIINLRQFTRPDTLQNYVGGKKWVDTEYNISKIGRFGENATKTLEGSPYKYATPDKAAKISENIAEHEASLVRYGYELPKGVWNSPSFKRLISKAYKSKASPQLSTEELQKLVDYDRFSLMNSDPDNRSLGAIVQRAFNSFNKQGPRPKAKNYNATQMVLLDPALQKQGAKAVNKLQIDELMNTPPEVLKTGKILSSKNQPKSTGFYPDPDAEDFYAALADDPLDLLLGFNDYIDKLHTLPESQLEGVPMDLYDIWKYAPQDQKAAAIKATKEAISKGQILTANEFINLFDY